VVAPTGEDGFFRASAQAFDLVVLDLMLPDYLVKPFALPEAAARIRALLRRRRPSASPITSGYEHATQAKGGHA
jgi:DNA-binding response OmpR family regulator